MSAAAASGDLGHLEECLRLAERARGETNPNPMVGAVVVRDGAVVGRGFHRRAGAAHAERMALEEAGEAARGATLYTNVEPCSHHGRTPPCTVAVIEAGIARVVSCMRDPDPRVNGRGFEELRDAGIEVEHGALAERAAELNAGYLRVKESGRPFVIAKAAMSLDARLAAPGGQSQWITGEAARRHAHEWRSRCDAVMVGSGTLLADDPRLTARLEGVRGPRVRAVLDSRLRTPPGCRLIAEREGQPVILTTPGPAVAARRSLEAAGATVLEVEADASGRVSLEAALRALVPLGVSTLMIEGGSAVLTSAFEIATIDQVLLYYAPLLIGGADGYPLWGGTGSAGLDTAPRLQRVRHLSLGEDLVVEGYLHPPVAPL